MVDSDMMIYQTHYHRITERYNGLSDDSNISNAINRALEELTLKRRDVNGCHTKVVEKDK